MLPDLGYIDCNLHVPKSAINVDGVKRALTFEYFEGQGRERKELALYQETPSHLVVPREFWPPGSFPFQVIDLRPQTYRKVNIWSNIKLDHEIRAGHLQPTGQTCQQEALKALLACRGGILHLACGRGKSIIAMEAMAQLKMPALVVVDNTNLLKQWQGEIAKHLVVPDGVGLIQAGVFDWKKAIVLATYHTLAARANDMPEEVRRWFGVGFWDECHHVNAPVFSKSANLFYGRRYGLTATPKRDDGLHIIHEFNFGDVFYRDLMQTIKPRIYFAWTGLTPDVSNPQVAAAIRMRNGELSLSKLSTYYGQWQPRLDFVLGQVQKAHAEGRKILVLSNSVNGLINMLALWNGRQDLYTDIPMPTPAEVGEVLPPRRLETEVKTASMAALQTLYQKQTTTPVSRKNELAVQIDRLETALKQHEVATKIDRLLTERQTAYLKKLLAMPSNAGLMIYKVPSVDRLKMLREKDVTFAIMKYGKEGLDEPSLDTVFTEPMSSRAMLQQVMGRVQRRKEGKKPPVFIVFEDNVGPIIGMCKKMRMHLRRWPVEQAGPYTYEFVGYPPNMRKGR